MFDNCHSNLSLSKKIYLIVYFFFVAIIMIDPTNSLFHLKDLAFIAFMLFSFFLQKCSFSKVPASYFLLLIFCAFLSISMGNLFFNTDIAYCFPYFRALLVVLTFFPLSALSVRELLKYNFYCSFALSLLISGLYLAILFGFIDFQTFYDQSIENNSTVIIAERQFLNLDIPMFYYKSMPFCFFGLIYALRKGKIIATVTQFYAILLAGSRTPILIALTIILYVFYQRYKHYLKYVIILIGVGGLGNLLSLLLSNEYLDSGDELKFKTVSQLIDYSSPIGHGVGAPYWSSSLGQMVTSSEVTYFEMLYQYGWLLYPIVLCVFFVPFLKLFNRKNVVDVRDFAFAYLMYLVNAGTNPLLFNSTGMFVFACCLTILSKNTTNRGIIWQDRKIIQKTRI